MSRKTVLSRKGLVRRVRSARRGGRSRVLAVLSLAAFAMHMGVRAQDGPLTQAPQAQSAQPEGTVTGQVISQDTQLPVRFAQVLLQSVSSVSADAENGDGGRFRAFGGSASTVTGADGSFTATDVAPGDYYVTAAAAGYIPERSLLTAAVAAGADPADLLARLPVVHVSADSISSVTLSLQRGGAIAGRVLWEDGSPAGGVSISAPLTTAVTLPAALQQIRSPGPSGNATTDDRGAFRLSGLAPGQYLVQAVIQNRAQFGGMNMGRQTGSAIRVYAPGVFHKADAKPLSIRAGEERDEAPLVIDLHGLHTVSGHVTSVTAGLSVASGHVTLLDPNDSSLRLAGSVDDHGEFTVQYVPPGNYTLQIAGASTEASTGYRERTPAGSTSFQSFSEPVSVSDNDLTGVTAALTPGASEP